MPAYDDSTDGVYLTLHDMQRLQGAARGFSLLPHQPPGSVLAGRHSSRLRGRGLDFRELRAYQQGDDIRLIDWLATARKRAPHSRVYAEERDRVVMLVVDQRQSMFFGSRVMMKSVAAAKAAALAVWRVQEGGDRIASIVFDDDQLFYVAAARGPSTTKRVLSDITRANNRLRAGGTPNPAMLNVALRSAARVVHHDFLVIIVTDAFGADKETAQLVTDMSLHGDVITAFVFDPMEAELPAIGQAVVAQGVNRLKVDTESTPLRAGHTQDFTARHGAVAAFGRKRAIPVITLRTDADIPRQIRLALAPRRQRA
jgi:uncharacterized protein (DUF58 family)